MGTNSNQKCSLLFLEEQIGIKLGRLGSYDILLPCQLDAILLSESRNLYRQSLCPSALYLEGEGYIVHKRDGYIKIKLSGGLMPFFRHMRVKPAEKLPPAESPPTRMNLPVVPNDGKF